ncbi:MAG: adenylosuccinate lyase [Zetaproteobacteria bacterium]|nr:adenylosuccinate lyase [Zetaproteobacteria bacterium]
MYLDAISPIDGRYGRQTQPLQKFFSESALICARIEVELTWLIYLAEVQQQGKLSLPWKPSERDLSLLKQTLSAQAFTKHTARVKEIEQKTNHDVKAVEYYLRELLHEQGVSEPTRAMVHFSCTSEDINNLAYGILLSRYHCQILLPQWQTILKTLKEMAQKYSATAMLSWTHGQPASPTTMGKEMAVFAARLSRICIDMQGFEFPGKMNGAVGNFNAHLIASPNTPWPQLSYAFIRDKLQLQPNPVTTQIENHDGLARWCHLHIEAATVLIDLARDLWMYIARRYFHLKVNTDEVGSSTMPHKVNPIDFENAEGNFGLAIALAQHFATKLPISRLQRDLSDSTVQRSLGSMAAYMHLGCGALIRGLDKITPNTDFMLTELTREQAVLGEAAQTIMRAHGIDDAYEQLKDLSRGKQLDKQTFQAFVNSTQALRDEDRARLTRLTPESYLGYAREIAEQVAST